MKHIRLLHAPIRAVAIAALAMSFAGSVAAAAGTQACKQRLLREFGWRFVSSESNAVEIHPGHPCDRRDLAEAKAAGDLTVAMPAGLAASERERVFDGLLRHPATHCAYGFALGAATRDRKSVV